MESIDTLIFDAEGVVVDTEPLWDIVQHELLTRHGCRYDREKIKPLIIGLSSIDGIRVLKRHASLKGDEQSLNEERQEIARRLFAREIRFIDGFGEYYRSVRDSYKTCIATSMSLDILTIADEALGLSSLFDDAVFSIADVDGRGKPDPALFLYAARQLQSPPARCLVIEDSPSGITAANRAGMTSIGLATTLESSPEQLAEADWVVKSFAELSTILDQSGWRARRP